MTRDCLRYPHQLSVDTIHCFTKKSVSWFHCVPSACSIVLNYSFISNRDIFWSLLDIRTCLNSTLLSLFNTFSNIELKFHIFSRQHSTSVNSKFGFKESLSVLILCTPVFIFTSGSSALVGLPRCGLSISLSLLAILHVSELMPRENG